MSNDASSHQGVQKTGSSPGENYHGTILRSGRFSYQTLQLLPDGYLRMFDNGRLEKFDIRGRLVRIADKNQNFIDITYDLRGKLHTIIDNFGRKITLTLNDAGLVEKLEGERSKTALYRYNKEGDLVYTKDVDGNIYEYQYDPSHNMTRINYTDSPSMEISYHPQSLHQNVRSVNDRDGTLTTYVYKWAPEDKNDFTTEVVVTERHTVSSQSSHRYITRRN